MSLPLPQVKLACMSLIDALVTAPASVIQRAWTVRTLDEKGLESIMEDLRTDYRDDEMLMLLCSQLKQTTEKTKKEMKVLRANHGFEIETPRDVFRALTGGAIKDKPQQLASLTAALKGVLSTLGPQCNRTSGLQRWTFINAALVSCLELANEETDAADVILAIEQSMRPVLSSVGMDEDLPVATMLYDSFQQWVIDSSPSTGGGDVLSSAQLLQQIEAKGFEDIFILEDFDEFLAPSEAEVAALKKQIKDMMAQTQADMDAAEEAAFTLTRQGAPPMRDSVVAAVTAETASKLTAEEQAKLVNIQAARERDIADLKAELEEVKAAAEGDLAVTKKDRVCQNNSLGN